MLFRSADLVRQVLAEVKASLAGDHLDDACALFEQVALDEEFVDFLTLPAYAKID